MQLAIPRKYGIFLHRHLSLFQRMELLLRNQILRASRLMGGAVDGAKVTDIGRNYVTLQSPEEGSEFRLNLR